MKSIKIRESFESYLKGQKHLVVPDKDQTEDQCRQLVHLIKLYREQEEAYHDKLRRNQFAVNEKDRLMHTRKQLDYLLHIIHF